MTPLAANPNGGGSCCRCGAGEEEGPADQSHQQEREQGRPFAMEDGDATVDAS